MTNYKSIILISFLFIQTITPQNWLEQNYKSISHLNFRSNKLFTEVIDFDMIDYARLNAAIFFVTNEERVKNDLPPLEYHPLLEKTATNHSKRMVKFNFFDHVDPYNEFLETPPKRGKVAGIENPYLTENIATPFGIKYTEGITIYALDKNNTRFSYTRNGKPIKNHTYLSLAEYVVYKWMNSEGHRKNVLSKEALQLGCGTCFYRERESNIPKFIAAQNFQLYEKIK